jgi:hypothetical protein
VKLTSVCEWRAEGAATRGPSSLLLLLLLLLALRLPPLPV